MSGKLSRTVLRRGKGSNPFSLVDYDNILIDDILTIFKIDRSLEQLQLQLAEHIYWYNNIRIHESLGYMTPVEYRELNTKKLGKAS